jgi:hypothetical protein
MQDDDDLDGLKKKLEIIMMKSAVFIVGLRKMENKLHTYIQMVYFS